jgi:integrase
MDDGKAALKSPKTPAGNRAVPITDDLFFRLSAYLPKLSGLYVFPGSGGGVMTINAFDAMWDRILRAVNLAAGGANGRFKVWAIADDITPHLCRHTNATILIASGVDIASVSKRLGHAKIATTIGTYTHAIESRDRAVADLLDDIFSKQATQEKKNRE